MVEIKKKHEGTLLSFLRVYLRCFQEYQRSFRSLTPKWTSFCDYRSYRGIVRFVLPVDRLADMFGRDTDWNDSVRYEEMSGELQFDLSIGSILAESYRESYLLAPCNSSLLRKYRGYILNTDTSLDVETRCRQRDPWCRTDRHSCLIKSDVTEREQY